MASIAVLGATGDLGRHVAREALQHGWDLSVAVRSRGRLAPEIAARARVVDLDLGAATPEQIAAFADGHDAFVCCAGVVTEGHGFVALIDRVVGALERARDFKRPFRAAQAPKHQARARDRG